MELLAGPAVAGTTIAFVVAWAVACYRRAAPHYQWTQMQQGRRPAASATTTATAAKGVQSHPLAA